jgi:hypothetical protein
MSGRPDDWREFERWANDINARKLLVPAKDQIDFLKNEIAKADPKWKMGVTTLFFSACESMNREDKQFDRGRELRYFWSGIVGVVLCVGMVLFLHINRSGLYVLQLVAGLSAAALLAYMPGMLEVDLKLKEEGSFWGGKIRGTSAGAAFLIVWFLLPSLLRAK